MTVLDPLKSPPTGPRREPARAATWLFALVWATALIGLPTVEAGAEQTVGGEQTVGTQQAISTGQAVGTQQAVGAKQTPDAGQWSQPATLSGCPGTGAPRVVFPSDSPTHGTGPGAIVWSTSLPCSGGAGVRVAAIGATDIPGRPTAPRTAAGRPIALSGPVAATAGPYGRIVIAGASAEGAGTPAGGLLLTEGPADGPFASPTALGGPASTFAFTTAYLGDVALASPGGAQLAADSPPGETVPLAGETHTGTETRPAGDTPTGANAQPSEAGTLVGETQPTGDTGSANGLQLRIQRHHSFRFAAPALVTSGAGGSVQALTVALNYRSDALAVWTQEGSVYARELPAGGEPHTVERLGPGTPSGAQIAAVISDDNRAIVAWTSRHDDQTSVYIARSQTGVRFAGPQLLERFSDPRDLPAYVDSPKIVRLSSESVMIAWTGAEAGHWIVRTAAIDLHGVRATSTISPPGRDALLTDLAPGPDGEALALWAEPEQTPLGLNRDRQAIFAARGLDAYPGQTIFTPGEQVAPPGPNSDPTVALDPDTDRAIAVWRTGAGAIAYAIRSPGAP
jgi:hypothetical protein